ncbi:DUF1826 domain-containing protein [Paracoccus sp. (in: a-proteobacteria)]|uniref:DUF1826 domain-containing protein n=1 Tax=Paracoccus sp. TaxID=267 RepID=UPI003A8C3DB5
MAFPARMKMQAILQSREPSVLRSISGAGIAATIWQRNPLPAFTDWINALSPDQLPRLRTLVRVGAVEPSVHAACDLAGTPNGPDRDMLASDIAALAVILAGIIEAPLLQLRLDVVSPDACRSFRIDNNTSARLLCSYRGTGTQLVTPGQGHAPTDVTTGSVALLRGRLWPGDEETALLHRLSLAGVRDETRLLAMIDPATPG